MKSLSHKLVFELHVSISNNINLTIEYERKLFKTIVKQELLRFTELRVVVVSSFYRPVHPEQNISYSNYKAIIDNVI